MAKRKAIIYEKMNVILHVFRFQSKDLDSTDFIEELFKIGREYCERFDYNLIGEYIDETPYQPHRFPNYDEIRRKYEDAKPLSIMTCGFNVYPGFLTYCSLAEEKEMREKYREKNPPPLRVRQLF